MHAEQIDHAHDREQKVSNEHLANLQQFDYQSPTLQAELNLIYPPLLILLGWLIIGVLLLSCSRNEV
jgi:ABC-2 type transport system permease protein